jgi:hypothetical protein
MANLAFYKKLEHRMRLISLLFLVCSLSVMAQRQNGKSRSELGFLLGGSYYIGDLNQFRHFYGTQPAAGLLYRYNYHSRLSFRANFTYGSFAASDADASNSVNVNRNLNFRSTMFELAGGLEFTYLPFFLGSERYKGTAYLLAEIGLFRMNPKTEYNGDLIELQPLGTEGQGSDLTSKKNYSLTQLCIPLGVGVKFALGKKAALSFEYGIRKTFTDYIDDVGSGSYVDPTALSAANGPLSAELSNRSLDGNRYGRRGNSSTKDWYSFFGAMVTFRLGKPNKCPMGS